jgi:hypothetical protein
LHEIFATSTICAEALAAAKIVHSDTKAVLKIFTGCFPQILSHSRVISAYYDYRDKGECVYFKRLHRAGHGRASLATCFFANCAFGRGFSTAGLDFSSVTGGKTAALI